MFDIDAFIVEKERKQREEIVQLRETARQMSQMLKRIETLGIEVPELSSLVVEFGKWIEITRHDLPVLYQAFGKPEIIGKYIKDKDAGLIWVLIKFPEQPDCGIFFKYEKELSEEAKCQIQEVVEKRFELVCSTGEK
jgi:hypothetical protein